MNRYSSSPESPDGDIQYKAKPAYAHEVHYGGLKMGEFNLEDSHMDNDEPFNDDESYYGDEQCNSQEHEYGLDNRKWPEMRVVTEEQSDEFDPPKPNSSSVTLSQMIQKKYTTELFKKKPQKAEIQLKDIKVQEGENGEQKLIVPLNLSYGINDFKEVHQKIVDYNQAQILSSINFDRISEENDITYSPKISTPTIINFNGQLIKNSKIL